LKPRLLRIPKVTDPTSFGTMISSPKTRTSRAAASSDSIVLSHRLTKRMAEIPTIEKMIDCTGNVRAEPMEENFLSL
jgi:hypothetical protein